VLHGRGRPITPVNTAGAGDALLAGWLAEPDPGGDSDPQRRLARAVSWAASACLSTTTVFPAPPDPGETDAVVVRRLHP
jgi:1-phosphofructokinase